MSRRGPRTPLRAHALDIVTGDFDGDAADEVVVAAYLGDSSTFLHLVRGTNWHLQAFAEHVGGGHLLGAGDIDADGRIEVVAGSYLYNEGPHAFEWRDGTMAFDRALAIPDSLVARPLGIGDVMGDGAPEMVFLDGEQVSIYSFALP